MNKRYTPIILAILILGMMSVNAFGQKSNAQNLVTIESTVTDENGNPIPGAIVSGKEGAIEVLSDANGDFTIQVAKNSVLLIEAKGYDDRIIPLNQGLETSSIRLEKSLLSEKDRNMVHVPFGTVMQKDVVGALTVIDAKELENYDNTQNVFDAIRGRVPGLLGNRNIRGIGNAVVIVDGIPRDASNINLAEVEQITVLKDANSAILYGSQAKNGVILVTTKRGKPYKRRINFQVEQGISEPTVTPEYLNSAQSMTLYNEALMNDGLEPAFSDSDIDLYKSGSNLYRYPDVDYYSNEFLKQRKPFRRLIGEFSGGTDQVQYFASVGWNHSESLFELAEDNGNADRFNVRANVDFKVNDYITSNIGAVIIYDIQNNPQGNFWGDAATIHPYQFSQLIPVSAVLDEASFSGGADLENAKRVNGDYILGGTSQFNNNNVYGNMLFAGYNQNIQRTAQLNQSLDVDLKNITEGLKLKTYLSMDFYNSFNQSVNDDYAVYQANWQDDPEGISSLNKIGQDLASGVEELSSDNFMRRTGTYGMLDYSRTFDEVHSVTGSVLGYFDMVNLPGRIIDEKNSHLGMRFTYGFKNKYLVDFSSAIVNGFRLPEGSRGGFSPSLGLAWVVKNEDATSSSPVNYLKLRVSGGIVNTDLSGTNYRLYENTLVGGGFYGWFDGNRSRQETVINRAANPNLTFEKMENLNIGMEGYFFNRSLHLDANVFTTRNSGQVVQRNIYPGFISNYVPYENYNATGYTGGELGLIWSKSLGEVSFDLGANVMYSTSDVVKKDELWENDYQYRQGRPADAIFGLEAIGLFSDDADIENSPEQSFGEVRPGDIKYKDQNNDNMIDQSDQIQIGNYQARLSYGLHARVSYKNFSLFAIGNGQSGSDRYFNGQYFWVQGNDKYSEEVLNRWTPETASTATYPRLSSGNNPNNFRNSTYWLYDNSYFSLSRVQLTYDLPKRISGVKNIAFYVRGMNLLRAGQSADKQQLRVGSEPLYRSYALGARFSF